MTTPPADATASRSRIPGADGATNFLAEFRRFLDQYGVIGLAIAFVIGQALTELVKAMVAGLLMPLINPILRFLGEDWRTAEATLPGGVGPFLVGQLAYATIYFMIIALFVFAIAKYVLRMKEVKKI